MKPKLYIVTGSPFKFNDLSARLSGFFDCEHKKWDEHEIQGEPEEIIRHKAKRAYEVYRHPVLVDDVSVSMEALNGFPGPYMKDFWKHMTPFEMGNEFAGSRIEATCYLGLCRGPEDIVIAQGTFQGMIVPPKNNDHKGRDFEIFVKLDGMDKVMLEYDPADYYDFSHRGRALQDLIRKLKAFTPTV